MLATTVCQQYFQKFQNLLLLSYFNTVDRLISFYNPECYRQIVQMYQTDVLRMASSRRLQQASLLYNVCTRSSRIKTLNYEYSTGMVMMVVVISISVSSSHIIDVLKKFYPIITNYLKTRIQKFLSYIYRVGNSWKVLEIPGIDFSPGEAFWKIRRLKYKVLNFLGKVFFTAILILAY